ncbi:MAG: glycosyltransferase family 4 protein [Endomicrobiales bacterium]|nr:glycosyltransferase family 4 protein [Endomicrobiales bacterium]
MDKNAKKNLNILMAIDSLTLDFYGGAGAVFLDYASGLIKKGHNVAIFFRNPGGRIPSEKEIPGVKVYTYVNNASDPLTFLIKDIVICLRTLKNACAEFKPDVINLHHPLPAAAARFVPETDGCPRVHSFQAPWELEYRCHKILKKSDIFAWPWHLINIQARNLIEKFALQKASKIVVLSSFMAELLTRMHAIDKERIVKIPASVDTERFKPSGGMTAARRRTGLPEKRTVILTIRRLVPRMGVENLLIAFKQLLQERSDALLVVGGAGPLLGRLKEKSVELGISGSVVFPGYIKEDLLASYYESADLFVLPTLELEGFGLVTLEALACGTPVAGTPAGATSEILSQFDKRLIIDGTGHEPIHSKISQLLADPALVSSLRNSAREFVLKNFSREVMFEKVSEFFIKEYAEN